MIAFVNHGFSSLFGGSPWLADEFPLTQEFISQMLVVHPPTVSLSASILQKAGLMCYVRGKMTILDREGLEATSCECYGITKAEFERLLGGNSA